MLLNYRVVTPFWVKTENPYLVELTPSINSKSLFDKTESAVFHRRMLYFNTIPFQIILRSQLLSLYYVTAVKSLAVH